MKVTVKTLLEVVGCRIHDGRAVIYVVEVGFFLLDGGKG